MDSKAIDSSLVAEKKKLRFFSFLKEFKQELYRVNWTTPAELKFNTKLVVLVTFVFGIGVYLADLLIKGALNGFNAFVNAIFG